jgi:hypothetical protein
VDIKGGVIPGQRQRLRRIPYYESFAVVARRGHPLAGAFDLTGYREADHVVVSFAGYRCGLVDARLEKLERTQRLVSTLPLFRCALQAVTCSDMIALVNPSLALAKAERLGLVVLAPQRELELAPYPVRAGLVAKLDRHRALLSSLGCHGDGSRPCATRPSAKTIRPGKRRT